MDHRSTLTTPPVLRVGLVAGGVGLALCCGCANDPAPQTTLQEANLASTESPGVPSRTEKEGNEPEQRQKPSSSPNNSLNSYILNAVSKSENRDKNKGYSLYKGSHTQSLIYNKQEIFSLKDGKSHCVGITFQILIEAFNLYFQATKDDRVWHTPHTAWKWAPIKHCWYVDPDEKCYGSNNALEKFGMGKTITDWKAMEPGDFVNLNRTKTGHSVIFMHYIDKNGKKTSTASEFAGFRYFSSQPKTKGVGQMNAYFHDKCNKKDPERDCGMKYPPWLFIGRVHHPSQFQKKNTFSFFLYEFLSPPIQEPVGASPYFAWESED